MDFSVRTSAFFLPHSRQYDSDFVCFSFTAFPSSVSFSFEIDSKHIFVLVVNLLNFIFHRIHCITNICNNYMINISIVKAIFFELNY